MRESPSDPTSRPSGSSAIEVRMEGDQAIHEPVEDNNGHILTILYATETGNAEEVAERIARTAYRRRVQARLYNLADYDKVCNYAKTDELDKRRVCDICRIDDW